MATVDLDAIRKRNRTAEIRIDRNSTPSWFIAAVLDGYQLIDEVARLRQELDEARAERDQALALLGDAYDANGKHQAERDRMRPVVEAAEVYRETWNRPAALVAFVAAVDAFRSSTPDAEPAPGGEPEWREIPVEEYLALTKANEPLSLGATISDPDGDRFGTLPHMLTTWESADGRTLLRHQCWPVGHVAAQARPCLYETTLPAPGMPVDTEEENRDA